MKNPKSLISTIALVAALQAASVLTLLADPGCQPPTVRPDQNDPPVCPDCGCPPGAGGSGGNGGHGGGGCGLLGCGTARGAGMQIWFVSDPYMNLWLEDDPLGYQPARGPRVAFHLSYRQRGAVTEESDIFGVGPNWSCSFRACLVNTAPGQFLLHRGGAGWIECLLSRIYG